ncbi:tRNA lysidine(34) synthetase TilS [Eremococcus coleocola]|uniref:tRNA(Ile)-lysidine synthase n=1 Tax=Eremococcus coleocola ACS-139-V-Col8 TaxID=908337 RepID=E4KMT7_9LACT|nr:tRNA lysidine(34) synthetase TilS [Eremococcus coleocola]EFR31755.1 tRNA(Ile)-lysidine synthetase [Eremococcus coleocola ACS-139-V-Col8]
MEALLKQVKASFDAWPQWQQTDKLVMGVSGGLDSMVLLDLMIKLLALKENQGKEIIVAHFNHHLRSDADLDASLVESFCHHHQLTYFIGEWQEPSHKNTESLAREARYHFFANVLAASQSQVLVTAHHSNDLAETLMIRLIRGTSFKGLAGIRRYSQRILTTDQGQGVATDLVRPLLSISKAELLDYAEHFKLEYREDSTNSSRHHLRNRVRQDLLPWLEGENPQFLANLESMTQAAAEAYQENFETYMAQEDQLVLALGENGWILDRPTWRQLSASRRRTFLTIFIEERLIADLGSYNKRLLDQLDQLICDTASPNQGLNLPSEWYVQRNYDQIRIFNRSKELGPEESVDDSDFHPLTQLNKWIWVDECHRVGIFRKEQVSHKLLSEAQCVLPLNIDIKQPINYLLRHRQPGDQIRLQDASGRIFHKKLARVMIDQKLPKNIRNQIWLLVDRQNQIMACLPNIKAAHPTIVSQEFATYLFLYQTIEQISKV